MGPAVCARLCSAGGRGGARDRVALRRPAADGVAPSPRTARRASTTSPRKWAAASRSTDSAAARVLLDAAGRDRGRAARRALPPGLAADFGITSVHLEPLLAGRAGRHARRSSRRPRRPDAELHSMLPLVAAAVAPRRGMPESRARPRRGGVPARADGGGAPRDVARRDAGPDLRAPGPRLGARRAPRSARGGRPPGAARVALRGRRARPDGVGARSASADDPLPRRSRPRATPASRSSRPRARLAADRRLVGRSTFEVGSLLAVPLGAPPGVVGVLMLDDPGADASPRRASDSPRRPPRRRADRSSGRARARSARSHLRAATAIRRLLEEGSRARLRRGGRRDARAGHAGGARRRARDAARCPTTRIAIEHVRLDGPDGVRAVARERVGERPGAATSALWRLATRQPKPIFVENAARQPADPARARRAARPASPTSPCRCCPPSGRSGS